MKHDHIRSPGFSLLELLATIVIATILAIAGLPYLQDRYKQAQVDAYTNRLEAGINQMKAGMNSRQDSCTIEFPAGAGSENEIGPSTLEQIQIDTDGAGTNCPRPTSMGTAEGRRLSMNTTDLRLVSIRNRLSTSQAKDIRLLISPSTITMTTIGGVTAPDANVNSTPLIIRVRSASLYARSRGFERCLKLEPMTGTLIRGTWIGSTFTNGSCIRNQ
jgi:prepilin-type N-terminal cleavage/methylation domain-containing protein